MDQTAFVLGAVAVRNMTTWGAPVAGSEAVKSAGSSTFSGQLSESRQIVQ